VRALRRVQNPSPSCIDAAKDRLMGILGDGEPSAFLPRPCRTREFVAKVNEVMGEKVAQ
jgi:hypothetical protein